MPLQKSDKTGKRQAWRTYVRPSHDPRPKTRNGRRPITYDGDNEGDDEDGDNDGDDEDDDSDDVDNDSDDQFFFSSS